MARTATSENRSPAPSTTAELEVDPDLILRLTGPGGSHLKALADEYGVRLGVRGNVVLLAGEPEQVSAAQRGFAEILSMLASGEPLELRDLQRAARTLQQHPEVRLREYMKEPILVAPRKTILPKSLAQARYVRAIRGHDVVFGIGPAGTGKTYLAMAMAVRSLSRGEVKRIVLTRPAVEAGEKLGFLPGDLAEKINPYLRPLYDALHDMMDVERAEMFLSRGVIEVAPLAFMRGRTLNDSFVILDEAQNSTSEQMKMFLTRLGFGSRAVVTGDVTQTDLPGGRRSGLADASSLLSGLDGIAFHRFSDDDVVRHPLVARIVRAYDERDEAEQRARDQAVSSSSDQPADE